MILGTLVLRVHSPWHAGTGRGEGAALDSRVVRTPGGLPFLPGRTLRGLLRQAVVDAIGVGALPVDADVALFGSRLAGAVAGDDAEGELAAARHATRPGSLRVGSAHIGEDAEGRRRWEAWAAQNPKDTRQLFVRFAATSIDPLKGSAARGTLRAIECAVPMDLRASLAGPEDVFESVRVALPFLRAIGAHRNRGFGRADAELS